ncbi:unnamed protein product [Meloidogyne enterolobii]|uniref:Uncharacterized protein n=1 Tax=Meloidogyne enterolobii TaxID=390850 RepID=A0ACB0YXB8_MELEN
MKLIEMLIIPRKFKFWFGAFSCFIICTLSLDEGIFFQISEPENLAYLYQINPSYHIGQKFPDYPLRDASMTYSDPPEGCEELSSNYGEVILLERGGCPFIDKVLNAQKAGAKIAIITDSEVGSDDFIDMVGYFIFLNFLYFLLGIFSTFLFDSIDRHYSYLILFLIWRCWGLSINPVIKFSALVRNRVPGAFSVSDDTNRKANISCAWLPGNSGRRIRQYLLYTNPSINIDIPLNYTNKPLRDTYSSKPHWYNF